MCVHQVCNNKLGLSGVCAVVAAAMTEVFHYSPQLQLSLPPTPQTDQTVSGAGEELRPAAPVPQTVVVVF